MPHSAVGSKNCADIPRPAHAHGSYISAAGSGGDAPYGGVNATQTACRKGPARTNPAVARPLNGSFMNEIPIALPLRPPPRRAAAPVPREVSL